MTGQPLVLIIEDDDELRQIYHQTLERSGFAVQGVSDSTTAIEAILAYQPDVIILDMMMPLVSGEMLLKALRDDPRVPACPLIVITAYPHYRETALSFDVDQFLAKPVRPADVVNAVRSALGEE